MGCQKIAGGKLAPPPDLRLNGVPHPEWGARRRSTRRFPFSATAIRGGIPCDFISGGGAWLATGYFLPARRAESQIHKLRTARTPRPAPRMAVPDFDPPADSRFLPPPDGVGVSTPDGLRCTAFMRTRGVENLTQMGCPINQETVHSTTEARPRRRKTLVSPEILRRRDVVSAVSGL
jgi:hypothetical protein